MHRAGWLLGGVTDAVAVIMQSLISVSSDVSCRYWDLRTDVMTREVCDGVVWKTTVMAVELVTASSAMTFR